MILARSDASTTNVYVAFTCKSANTSTVCNGCPLGAFFTCKTFATTVPLASWIVPWSANCPPISA